MAGSDAFQQSLNRKAYDFSYEPSNPTYETPNIERPDVTDKGGLAYTPAKNLEYTDTSNDYTPMKSGKRFASDRIQDQRISTGSNDYSMFESKQQPKYSNKPSSIQGPGEFGAQVQREKDLLSNNFQDTGYSHSDFMKTYGQPSGQGSSNDDIFGIANAAIKSAQNSQTFDIEALDRNIRQRPLYHEAKSKLEGLKTYGDSARWSREMLPDFKMPEPMEAVEKPDFDKIYDRTKDDLDSLKI